MGAVRSCPQCTGRKCVPNRDTLKPEVYSSGLPAPLLRKKLHDALSITSTISLDFTDGHLDVSSQRELMQHLDLLAYQAVVSQACIISASAGETSGSPVPIRGGQNFPQATYTEIRRGALECLRTIGDMHTALLPALIDLATPAHKSWSPQVVPLSIGQTGKGYLNTFEDNKLTDYSERRLAFARRLENFLELGGSFTDVIELGEEKVASLLQQPNPMPSFWTAAASKEAEASSQPKVEASPLCENLIAGQWYDYVITQDHTIRLYPSSASARMEKPVCGHTLLAYRDPAAASDFDDSPILMAGDICALKGLQGDLEVLIVTNNSGHFKPRSIDLPNVLPVLGKFGVPESRVCLFTAPNNLLSLRRDLLNSEVLTAGVNSSFSSTRMLDPYNMVASWEG